MGLDFSLSDDNVLLLSGVVTAAHSANMLLNTRGAHDMFYKMQTGSVADAEHVATARWCGHSLGMLSAATISVSRSDNSRAAKKNLLKASAAGWALSGAMHAWNASEAGGGVQKADVAAANVAVAAAMAALCAWRGFKEEDDD